MNIIELFEIKPRNLKLYVKFINKLAEVKYKELDTLTKKILYNKDKTENKYFWDTITDKYSTTNNIEEIQEFVSKVYAIYQLYPNNKYSEDLKPLDLDTNQPIDYSNIHKDNISGFCYDRVTYFEKIIDNVNESSIPSADIAQALENVLIDTVDIIPSEEQPNQLQILSKKVEKIANVPSCKKGLLYLGMLEMI